MNPPYRHEHLIRPLRGLVIGDSLQRKDTVDDLTWIKQRVLIGVTQLRKYYEDVDLQTTTIDQVAPYLTKLAKKIAQFIFANIVNRDLTQQAKELLKSNKFSPETLGYLIDAHHTQLAEHLGISTPKIEKLIEAAKEAGALGCKINGSGFGGSMIAYAPNNTDAVVKAIERAGGKAYPVVISEGCKLSSK